MEKDSFVFCKSFYEAINGFKSEIRLEVLTAIIEYGLYGRVPQALGAYSKSIFTLVKPNLDANLSRYNNGVKGGRPKKIKASASADSFEKEVELIRADKALIRALCSQFSLTVDELGSELDRFQRHCISDKKQSGEVAHKDMADARRHLRNWLAKVYTKSAPNPAQTESLPETDYSFNGGFGGLDN